MRPACGSTWAARSFGSKVADVWALGRPVGAICHGVLVLARTTRSRDRAQPAVRAAHHVPAEVHGAVRVPRHRLATRALLPHLSRVRRGRGPRRAARRRPTSCAARASCPSAARTPTTIRRSSSRTATTSRRAGPATPTCLRSGTRTSSVSSARDWPRLRHLCTLDPVGMRRAGGLGVGVLGVLLVLGAPVSVGAAACPSPRRTPTSSGATSRAPTSRASTSGAPTSRMPSSPAPTSPAPTRATPSSPGQRSPTPTSPVPRSPT